MHFTCLSFLYITTNLLFTHQYIFPMFFYFGFSFNFSLFYLKGRHEVAAMSHTYIQISFCRILFNLWNVCYLILSNILHLSSIVVWVIGLIFLTYQFLYFVKAKQRGKNSGLEMIRTFLQKEWHTLTSTLPAYSTTVHIFPLLYYF